MLAGLALMLTAPAAIAGDKINLTTGEYFMDMGGGDQMNLSTGEYIMAGNPDQCSPGRSKGRLDSVGGLFISLRDWQ
jgi:hypothetical protein